MLCTSNLAGHFWSPVNTNIPGTDGTVRVIDTNAATQPRRFLPGTSLALERVVFAIDVQVPEAAVAVQELDAVVLVADLDLAFAV